MGRQAARTPPKPATNWPGDQMGGAQPEHERGAGDREGLDRYGNGGLKTPDRLSCSCGIEILHQRRQAGDRTAALKRFLLAAEPVGAIDVALHGEAALARQSLLVALQSLDSLRPRQRLALGLAVELRDHATELVEGAAEALTILLGEFRQLRADEGA